MIVLQASWIQSRDGELWGDPSPCTNHRGVCVWSISGQFVDITHGSPPPLPIKVLFLHSIQPSNPFTPAPLLNLPHTQPYNLGETFSSVTVIFIEFPITLQRLQLNTGDWSLWLCGSQSGASGMLRLGARVGGGEVIGCLFFLHRTGENTGPQSSFIDGLLLSLGPGQMLPGFKPASVLVATNKGISLTGSYKYTIVCRDMCVCVYETEIVCEDVHKCGTCIFKLVKVYE